MDDQRDDDTPRVRVERDGHVTILTMQRFAKRNAIDAAMTAALGTALDAVDDDPETWVAIVTGGPEVFCAGTDLAVGSGDPTPRGGEYGVIRRRRTTPLVAAIEGVAFGGGFEIAMACDIVVASTTARFALPEVRRGVIATSGALFRAANRFPPNVAKHLLLTGREMGVDEAHRLGFVNVVTEPGGALVGARAVAEQIASAAPVSVSQTLQAVDAILRADDDAGWAATERALDVVARSEDVREGIAAFFERRPPQWRGR